MKNMKNQQNKTLDIKPNIHDSQTEDPSNNATKTPIPDTGSVSLSCTSDNRKVSREDIELVQNLIERCLQLYMNKDEVVNTLLNRARIDPGFTTLVWQKLEEENADFFRAYYIRLKLKKQIILFNHFLDHQYHMMKCPVPPKLPLSPIPTGIPPIPVNNLPMGYPITHHHPSLRIVNGVPAPANFHPIRMNNMVIGDDISPIIPPSNSMSDVPISPTSVASSGHFAFTASDISGIGVDADTSAFTSDMGTSVGLHLPTDNGVGSSRDSMDQIPWNFSLSDLTADLSNLGDLGALGNYPGSPFLPSDSDILLDSPEQEGIVDEFFVDSDSIPGQCLASDEEKS